MHWFPAVWTAVVVAAQAAYLGLAPWLRRRPVRVTLSGSAGVSAVAIGPGLAYLGFQAATGGLRLSASGVLPVVFVAVVAAVVWTAWRGLHVFHGTTAEAFRDAWRAALEQLGHAYEVQVGGGGRIDRVVLVDHPERVELTLRSGSVRGRGVAGRAVAAEVAEAIDHYFDTHDSPLDRVGTGLQVVAAVVLLAVVLAPLVGP